MINEVIEFFIRYLYFTLTSGLICTALSSFLLSRILIPSNNRRLFFKYLLGIQFGFMLISFVTISFFLILGALVTLLVFSSLLILFSLSDIQLTKTCKNLFFPDIADSPPPPDEEKKWNGKICFFFQQMVSTQSHRAVVQVIKSVGLP